MKIISTFIIIVLWQFIVFGLHAIGEVDKFWFITLEIMSVIASAVALLIAFFASLDWR